MRKSPRSPAARAPRRLFCARQRWRAMMPVRCRPSATLSSTSMAKAGAPTRSSTCSRPRRFAAQPEARSFRRQDKPALYARNGPAVLGLTRATIVEQGQLHGERILPIEMGRIESHDIDDPVDLLIAEALLPLVLADREPSSSRKTIR